MSYQTHPVHLVGGRICLDFLNTANWNPDGSIGVERLTSVDDLAEWTKAVGLLCCGAESQLELEEIVLAFRGALRRVISCALAKTNPAPADLAIVNGAATQTRQFAALEVSHGSFVVAPDLPLTCTLSLSAIAVLTDPREIGRIKMCPGDGCGWMFLDESANGRRQWCSMEMCGNREKARRHYAKKRGTL